MKNVLCAWLVLVLSGSASWAGAELEDQLRGAMKVPGDYQVVFQSDDGTALTADQAKALMAAGRKVVPVRDDQRKVLLVRIEKEEPPLGALPTFDLKTLDGKRLRNADLAGRPTLVNFFFETCVPCIKEAPALNAFARRHPELNYLAVTFDSQADARRFVQQRKFTWPVLADAGTFIQAAGIRGYPTYLLIAADGRVLGRGSGMNANELDNPKAIEAYFERWVTEKLK
jgi:thiol-disulfide isomerase/thioredoxin